MNKALATEHPLYVIWVAMRQRCNDPNFHHYHRYGGRGIRVCARWSKSFWDFAADMGPRPSGKFPTGRVKYSLDRKNTNGNYTPTNCRWATKTQQSRNMQVNRRLTLNGETLLLCEWAERLGVNSSTLDMRLAKGWSTRRTLTTPIQNRKLLTLNGETLAQSEWAKRLGMSDGGDVIGNRLRRGWSLRRALTTDRKGRTVRPT